MNNENISDHTTIETSRCLKTNDIKEIKIFRQNAFSTRYMFILDAMPTITDLLQRSKVGKIILQAFKTNKELSGSMRNKLCNIIIGYIEDNNIVCLRLLYVHIIINYKYSTYTLHI